ncbi:hypothetical protein JRC04_14570 [Mycolicibacterium sp. S2-37]|uniref:hypothetical protein n=1 Tax=Mycolicibacterium sp. S2-37 TaxID=2810297 RepID=UPI001A93CFFC|nr:hypothetical protein [Mycolicibacterium sp. S2-37]MBO0678690.1 hypothetical protein [Mycolicibacterium sp. S2-37]
MPAPDHVHTARSGRTGVLAGLALVLAVAALALSGWTWWQSRAEPTYSESQQSAAKDSVCGAFSSVRTGVATNTHLTPPGGDGDVTGALATAANARGALMDGGQYLLTRLEPATPPELADAVRRFANGLLDFGAAATAGAQNTDPAQEALSRELDTLSSRLGELCGA